MSSGPRSLASRVLRSLALVAAGAGLAVLLIVNPLGLPLPWGASHDHAADGAAQAKQLWTCGMHPQVIEDHPGTCPICHMALTPLRAEEAAPPPPSEAKQLWTCGMHPQVIQDHPGTCPICHMALTPLRAEEPAPAAQDGAASADAARDSGPVVTLDPSLAQRMNVTWVPVVRRDLVQHVRTVGYVDYDHERETTVTVKFRGYVEHVHVHLVGQHVQRGTPLFEIYSPELVQTQQDLLAAVALARRLEGAGDIAGDARRRADDLAAAARERLRLWDISPAQIARVESTGKASRLLTVTAPAAGVITEQLDSLSGMEVSPGMSIYTIADVSSVWVTAEVYEDQVAGVESQHSAWVTFEGFPGERLQATVRAVKPWVERETRTVHLTLSLPNPGGRLRQGMYAHVEFEPVAVRDALVVPSQAILRTGERNVAIVVRGEGRFAPREVQLGVESDGDVQVISGLAEGDEIVTSAQFLIDSESSLKAAVQAMLAGHQQH